MEEVAVTTILHAACGWFAGSCYSPTDDSLLLADSAVHRVYRIFSATDKRKADLKRVLRSSLLQRGALPIKPLISTIFEYAIGNSK